MTGGQDAVEEAKQLIPELCSGLYAQGHVGGTGGGISIKVSTPDGDRIVMAPSGVQKERMRPEDMFVLDAEGTVLHAPEARPPPYKPPKLSECAPLFMSVRDCTFHGESTTLAYRQCCRQRLVVQSRAHSIFVWLPPSVALLLNQYPVLQPMVFCAQAFELRGAGAVLHGHSMNAFLATLLDPTADELRVTHIEMIKGIAGQAGSHKWWRFPFCMWLASPAREDSRSQSCCLQGFYSVHAIPIIENTARECELTDRLRAAIEAYPQASAVLVRRHGVYVWGRNWIEAKTQVSNKVQLMSGNWCVCF
jgi:methylthioribulose 1-phosphate dehydratase/enolase-phosphatase E1